MTGTNGGAGGPEDETARLPRIDPGAGGSPTGPVRVMSAVEGSADSAPPPSSGRARKRFRWRSKDYSPEELEQAQQAWRAAMPWDHPMSRGDKVLVFSTLGVVLLMVATMPVRPFLLASHPIALSAVTGSLSAIGAGAAFARIGEGELWLVIAAGVFGMIKFDWLFWLAGRRWGAKIVELFAPGGAAKRLVSRVRSWPAWAMPLVVMAAALPGIPAPAVYAVAGLAGMRLTSFLIFDALGAALVAGLVAGLGHGVGQHAVDVVLMIDEYALWITLALVVVVSARAAHRGHREDRAKRSGGRPAA
ncbi:DedA family protein [Pseudonocardia kunmingensis]|uniref:Membrane protein DedA with SNARE-associated domain n=1 Tax=Pseudonocardia kunmingensis TaxID=630975 RepID=A0A543D0C0_9PSEU|nr:DedA family protein [Pseudonocardia kunmingensis]TQM02794.1 membrane protein DedA with SNARE-associated domain [Pseudonocardia kunmingensis]